ncbi:hypothetical protein [Pseudoalteromonas luteoviolacea]|uniref:Uncharacterized protein n=1 Tax=Pseudoalteromonas luteoviolacea S4060-1 TaxID=1365257 RepID=A0A161YTB8_9GAMM|nr:hypothetical protein [Pseudoalteromonas luteoviolacea]KZN29072.1 hypothetical protein N480_09905 [Pseudoalteromonas luteoviolacea S2607]KZN65580.1 hypothetical protein N478_21000 [Pseudoalteromonas luteoviolacea S4060-1]
MQKLSWSNFLSSNERYWDVAGILFGAIAGIALLGQLFNEMERQGDSTLSMTFLFGYVVVFSFWLLYGVRFKRPAIIVTNLACLILQSWIVIVVLS